jgi:outer membrane protein OmpA-like peptidoglycan-associated protein
MTRQWLQPLIIALPLCAGLMPGLAAPAAAQRALLLDEQASPCAMFQALSPTLPARCQVRTRSIVFRPPAGGDTAVADAAPAASPARPSAPTGNVDTASGAPSTRPSGPAERVYAFTTRIPFAWDSARLAPEAHQLLDTLADVLQDGAMAEKVIRIEGHTDGAGSEAYNLRLSYARALAVQQYLRDAHGLAPSRLHVVGRGKAELYDPDHPYDPSNRRVEFVNLTDSVARP